MYVKYACTYINGEKVILSTNGFCNMHKYMDKHNMDYGLQSWIIRVKGTKIKLSRLMAHLFIDPTFDIIEKINEKGRDRVVVFINENPLDLRIDNIQIMSQVESANRHYKAEDDFYLVNMKGKLVDSGRVSKLSEKYGVNKGCFYDIIQGNNATCKLNTGERCIVVKGTDYNVDKVKERVQEILNVKLKRTPNKDTKIVQVDVNGNIRENTIGTAGKLYNNEAGIRMCLNGKRKSASGYIWIFYDEYMKNPDCVIEKLNEVKNSKFYGSKTILKKF